MTAGAAFALWAVSLPERYFTAPPLPFYPLFSFLAFRFFCSKIQYTILYIIRERAVNSLFTKKRGVRGA